MPIPSGSRALAIAHRGFERDVKQIFRRASDQIGGIIQRGAGSDGLVQPREELQIIRPSGDLIRRLFVGSDGRSAFAADGFTPLAPYPEVLNKWIVYVSTQAVYRQRDWMKRTVSEDVYTWLRGARVPEGITTVREMIDLSAFIRPGFAVNPLRQFQINHLFIHEDGKKLSDRIWKVSGDTGQKIDALLVHGIRTGQGALQLSRLTEQFLLPGRAPIRTRKPYGTDASFDSMRLGRTEITWAGGQTTIIASRLNPYVTGINWNLSPSHPRADVCDGLADGSPYEVDNVPPYPPHPQCMCNLSPAVTKTPAQVTEELRQYMNEGYDAPFTPVSENADGDNQLLLLLLGAYLFYNLARRVAA
jgi:hypothetical protein